MGDHLGLLNKKGDHFSYPDLGTFFFDCGAYSVLTGVWNELPIDEHIQFVIKYHSAMRLLAAPDVIGSTKKTFEYLKYFVKRLQGQDDWASIAPKVLITYHLVDKDLDTFSEMAIYAYGLGIRWLAIGGLVVPGVSNEEKWIGLKVVMDLVHTNLQLPFKLHLFGGTNLELVQSFRPDSIDSSSYLAKSQLLVLIRFDSVLGELLTLVTRGYTNPAQVDLIMNILSEYDLGVDRSQLKGELLKCPPAVRCMLSNLVVTSGVEAYIQKKIHKPYFKYFVSVASGGFVSVANRHGNLIAQVYHKYWRDRCLFSYGTLWEKNGSVSKEWLRTFFR